MNNTLKWTLFHRILLMLVLISFLGFILYLIIIWDQIPERLATNQSIGTNAATKYSRKAFALIPMLLIESIFITIITLISFFPTAWTNVSKYFSNEAAYKNKSLEKATRMTRTLLLFNDLLLVNFFNFIYLSMIHPKIGASPIKIGIFVGFGSLCIISILFYTLHLRQLTKGFTHSL